MAIVCDDLIQQGGAEEVFLDVISCYPKAIVYTSYISDYWKNILKDRNIEYRTSFLQKFPLVSKLYRFYSILYLHVLAFEGFEFSSFDLVLSLSSRYAHLVFTKPTTKHVCYMHSPARMFWNTKDYFGKEFWNLFLPLIYPFLFFSRMTDYIAAQRVDLFLVNSRVTQKRVKRYYHKESIVLNPSIEISNFHISKDIGDYFFIVSRLTPWKRIDLVIEAVNKLGLKLKISGYGSDLPRLKYLARNNPNIEFLGRVSDEEKYKFLSKCKALIYPQKEDFGIVPLECMASGRPVIAYGAGGALETVIPGETGLFFSEQSVESLMSTFNKYDDIKFISDTCVDRARQFDKKLFKSKLEKLLNDVYLKSN